MAKWLEAACYSLIRHPDSALAALVEEAVDMIRGAQQKDGYLNTYYSVSLHSHWIEGCGAEWVYAGR